MVMVLALIVLVVPKLRVELPDPVPVPDPTKIVVAVIELDAASDTLPALRCPVPMLKLPILAEKLAKPDISNTCWILVPCVLIVPAPTLIDAEVPPVTAREPEPVNAADEKVALTAFWPTVNAPAVAPEIVRV